MLSPDHADRFNNHEPSEGFSQPNPPAKRPRVVIIGAGFGGIEAARGLAKADVDITLIDRRNYHLFQPLLYQVATAALSPGDVAWPIRGMFSNQKNIEICFAKVEGTDLSRKRVILADREVPFDFLIIATGAKHSYFGKEEWEPHAPGLKRVIDAIELRKRILIAFEKAEMAQSEEERKKHLTFVVVGGGPTGVEMAGAIAELAHHTLAADFRNIDPKHARIMLLEANDRVLKAFEPDLSDYAEKALEKLGVEVVCDRMVTVNGDKGVLLGEESIAASTVIWAAGVSVPKVKKWTGAECDRAGRVLVNDDLSVPGHGDVFVIGDAAAAKWNDGYVPGIAPAAKQGGKHVAGVIRARISGKSAPPPFRYKHHGNLATIGRHAAVADLGWIKLKGWFAWWFWGIAHIYFLINVRAAFIVAAQWFFSYLTFSRGARLITGTAPLYEALESAREEKAQQAPEHVET